MAIPITVAEVGAVAESINRKPHGWIIVFLIAALVGVSWRLIDVENKREVEREKANTLVVQYEKEKGQIATDCLLEQLKTAATIDELKRLILGKEQPKKKSK